MRVQVRVGLGVGAVGFLLLYLVQRAAGLGALALLAVVALVAGLGVAKWLPREWYGRQLEAGVRTGALACGLAVLGLLVSISVAGQHNVAVLARQSHLLGFNLAGPVRLLGIAGWLGAAIVLSVVGGAVCVGLSALVALLAAWGKNRRAIEVVRRAREAAQRTSRHLSAGPASGRSAPLDEWQPGPFADWDDPDPFERAAVSSGSLRAALAAWATGRNGRTEKHGRSKSPPDKGPPPHRSDQDDWLC